MNHLSRRKPWLLPALFAGLIVASGAPACAQLEKKLDKKVRQYLSIEKLPTPARSLIISAVESYDHGEYSRSIAALNSILAGNGKDKPKRSLRAWANQWLALNHAAVKDSIAVVKNYVELSIDADVEIWREYAEPNRMPLDLREIYEDYWDGLQEKFDKKRHSWRLGLGTISRIDYGYRSSLLEVSGGIGAPVVVDIHDQNFRIRQVLLYLRVQRMRRTIERITAGLYVEPASLAEKHKTDNKLRITAAIGVGVVITYPYKNGWEVGGSVEGVRLLFEKSIELTFSQTKKIGNSTLSYGNFEIYIRKWF